MFATFANPEEFRPFVVDYERDIVSLSTDYAGVPTVIANRLAQIGARLGFPACGEKAMSMQAVESSYSYTGFMNPQTVQYFRLGSENFYRSGTLKLRVIQFIIMLFLSSLNMKSYTKYKRISSVYIKYRCEYH